MGNAPLQNPCFGLYFMKKRGIWLGILRAQKTVRTIPVLTTEYLNYPSSQIRCLQLFLKKNPPAGGACNETKQLLPILICCVFELRVAG